MIASEESNLKRASGLSGRPDLFNGQDESHVDMVRQWGYYMQRNIYIFL
jgi:hypothetical protein